MHSDNNKSQGSIATHLRCGGLALLENYRTICGERIFKIDTLLAKCHDKVLKCTVVISKLNA